ncbi:hypothetical protein LWI28_011167 [Acer negundo]|uniref:Uncharacterized protein n=1 Tax=Acer negundo TaxID=4023 RepID=A0AAD5JSG9_ACENE|nr:hypothetical protein LWI28_011167 [Acer negundo]
MVVVHGDCGRNLSSGASSVMDPMFIEASLFVGVSFDSPPSEVPKSGLSSHVGLIEASFGFISICVWVDPLVGTCSHSDKGNSVLPSHANGLSSAKDPLFTLTSPTPPFLRTAYPIPQPYLPHSQIFSFQCDNKKIFCTGWVRLL